eukprot:COSAG02_NODE_973_length_15536_cov_5.108635_9_plen_60_part_00
MADQGTVHVRADGHARELLQRELAGDAGDGQGTYTYRTTQASSGLQRPGRREGGAVRKG